MARRQTRRALSLNRGIIERLRVFAVERRTSMAKVAEQALCVLMDGQQVAPQPAAQIGTCATCSERRPVTPTRLDEGGPEYPICEACNTTTVPDVPRGRARSREARA